MLLECLSAKESDTSATHGRECINTSSLPVVMLVFEGPLFSHQVTVLRDTSSNMVIFRKDLVLEDSFTEMTSSVSLLDGRVKLLPEALIRVHTLFFAGTLPALRLDWPLYYLVLGSVLPGVRALHNPDPAWKCAFTQDVNTEQAGC